MAEPGNPHEGTRTGRRRTGEFVGRSAAGLIALALGAAAFGLLVVLVQTDSALVDLDRRLAAELNDLVAGRPLVLTVLGVITDLGGVWTSSVVLSVLTVALLVRRQYRLALYVAVTGLGALVLSPAVKEIVGRLRPMVEVPVGAAPGPSFPSGHALGSLVTYGVVLLVLLPAVPARWRRTAVVAVAVLVALIGFTRIALGVHFLSDVIGGWLLGLGWVAITTTAFRVWRREERRPVPPVRDGLAPEVAPAVSPAPRSTGMDLSHPVRRGAVLAVTWVLLFGLLLAVGWTVTQPLARGVVGRFDTAVLDVVGALGGTAAVLTVAVVVAVLALAVTRQWRPVLFLAAVLVGEITLFLAAASVIDRPRPPVPHIGPDLPPTASFPSGHVSAAISLYGAAAVLVVTRTRTWWRWTVVAAAVLAVVLVALARLYYGAHYPTDVLGSVLFAVPWLLACRYVLRPEGGDGYDRASTDGPR
ncbi:phosphatase PAP2 family protein [Thermobifida halotolerans]|nr:phosphatase PAP2 family protein [Thermobifida halotolerans]